MPRIILILIYLVERKDDFFLINRLDRRFRLVSFSIAQDKLVARIQAQDIFHLIDRLRITDRQMFI